MIWPLFGTTNQLLAGLTLLVLSVYLLKNGRRTIFTLAPMVFILSMTLLALLWQLRAFFESGQYFLVALDVVILGATIMVVLESLGALKNAKGGGPPAGGGGQASAGTA